MSDGDASAKARQRPSQHRIPWCRVFLVTVSLTIMIACWITEAEVIQGVQDPGDKNYYPKPYMLNWAVGSAYIAFLPLWLVTRVIRNRLESRGDHWWEPLRHDEKRLFKWMPALEILYFASGYTWYYSLPRTSVAANTIIYDLIPIFVYPFSVMFLKERPTVAKIMALLLAMGGMVAVTISSSGQDSSAVHQSWEGYLSIVLCVILNALFNVLFAKYVEEEEEEDEEPGEKDASQSECDAESLDPRGTGTVNATGDATTPLLGAHGADESSGNSFSERGGLTGLVNLFCFLGFSGILNLLFFWPGIVILHYARIEVFEMPSMGVVVELAITSALDATMNMTNLFVIVMTTPIFMALSNLLGIPAAIFADLVLHAYQLRWMSYIGLGLILFGYLCYGIRSIVETALRRHLPPSVLNRFIDWY